MEETEKPSITVETIVKTPIDHVWKTWTDPKHITQWYNASPDWHAPFAENDLKVGGKFKSTMAAKDGSFSFESVSKEIGEKEIVKTELSGSVLEDKKKILTAVLDEPHIISEILDICSIPQTSGYRKINSLINDGLLTTKGFITTSDGKRVNKYISVFDNVRINIIKNKVIVKVKLGKDSLNDSTMIQLIRSL